MNGEIVNRVAKSKLISFDLEEYYSQRKRVMIDLKDWLYQGLIIKEKDFREQVKNHDWSFYSEKNVAIVCSVEAIVPTWAYMLLTISLEPVVNMVVLGDFEQLEIALFNQALAKVDLDKFKDAKVVVNGCSKLPVPDYAYVEVTRLLRPYASSIMFGEPCSTVPLYKARKG
mgnify:CR=1 FL=1